MLSNNQHYYCTNSSTETHLSTTTDTDTDASGTMSCASASTTCSNNDHYYSHDNSTRKMGTVTSHSSYCNYRRYGYHFSRNRNRKKYSYSKTTTTTKTQKTVTPLLIQFVYMILSLFSIMIVLLGVLVYDTNDLDCVVVDNNNYRTSLFTSFVVTAATIPSNYVRQEHDEQQQEQEQHQFKSSYPTKSRPSVSQGKRTPQQQQKQKQQQQQYNSPTIKIMMNHKQRPKKGPFQYTTDSSSSSSSSPFSQTSMNGTDFFQSVFRDTRSRKPRHVIEGVWLGLKAAIRGTIMALVSLLAVPILWYQKMKSINGIIQGVLYGVVYASIFAVMGYWHAIQKVWQGLLVTPTAVRATHTGQQWNTTSQQYESYYIDRELADLLSSKHTDGSSSTRRNTNVVDMTYYDILNIPSSASSKDIKQSYYRIARDIHPDKNPSDTDAAERFRILHIAYTTLYDDMKRSRYDKYGIQSSDYGNDTIGTSASSILNFDPNVFFAVVFNSQLVEPYIGELHIASFTDDIIHMANKKQRDTDDYIGEHQQTPEEILKLFFSNNGNNNNNNNKSKTSSSSSSSSSSWASKYYDEYKTRKRQLDIAVFLRTQIDPYVNGQMDKYEFRIACHDEARKIATGSYYGAQFLYIIGTALTLEAQQDISYQQRFFSTAGIVQTTKTITNKTLQSAQRLSIAVQKVYTIFRIIIDAARENHDNNNGTPFPEHLNKRQRAKVEEQVRKILPPLMDMAWAYTSHDIVKTIHGACRKLFIDASCTTCDDPTASTTMSNTKKSSNMKNTLRKKRADAILIMGEEFLLQSSSSPLLMSSSSQSSSYHTYKSSYSKDYTSTGTWDDFDLMTRLEVAYHLSTVSTTGRRPPGDTETIIKQQQYEKNNQQRMQKKRIKVQTRGR